jgi:iron complex outermembrane receptor protein
VCRCCPNWSRRSRARRSPSAGCRREPAWSSRRDIARGQSTLGPDEFLNNIPGVYVQNRYNFSQGQRIEIRGAGARANFGIRGIKVLLDGVPQTLPDGQSQVTNVEWGLLERADVLRGAASAIYGNATGGVVAYQSLTAGPEAFAQRVRGQAGSFGSTKWQAISTTRMGDFSGVLVGVALHVGTASASRVPPINGCSTSPRRGPRRSAPSSTCVPRRRQSAAGESRRPQLPEYDANPDSAPANNILREANNATPAAAGVALLPAAWTKWNGELQVALFGINRDVANPLATGPAGPPSVNGIYNGIDRRSGGVRASYAFRPSDDFRVPRFTAGFDYQKLRDKRLNQRSVSGEPTDSILLQQTETVTEVGPFAAVRWTPNERLVLDAGARYDWVTFTVQDEYFADGVDNSGELPQNSLNGSFGASYFVSEGFIPYGNVSTAFETPTTTELVNQPGTTGGFNTSLDPQRTLAFELGVRGRAASWLDYSVDGFVSRVTDAIVQYQEVSGRGYFTNAGEVRNAGVELNLTATPVQQVRAFVSFRYANYEYTDYKLDRAAAVSSSPTRSTATACQGHRASSRASACARSPCRGWSSISTTRCPRPLRRTTSTHLGRELGGRRHEPPRELAAAVEGLRPAAVRRGQQSLGPHVHRLGARERRPRARARAIAEAQFLRGARAGLPHAELTRDGRAGRRLTVSGRPVPPWRGASAPG